MSRCRYPFRSNDLTCHRIKSARFEQGRLQLIIVFGPTCFPIFLTKEELTELLELDSGEHEEEEDDHADNA